MRNFALRAMLFAAICAISVQSVSAGMFRRSARTVSYNKAKVVCNTCNQGCRGYAAPGYEYHTSRAEANTAIGYSTLFDF